MALAQFPDCLTGAVQKPFGENSSADQQESAETASSSLAAPRERAAVATNHSPQLSVSELPQRHRDTQSGRFTFPPINLASVAAGAACSGRVLRYTHIPPPHQVLEKEDTSTGGSQKKLLRLPRTFIYSSLCVCVGGGGLSAGSFPAAESNQSCANYLPYGRSGL